MASTMSAVLILLFVVFHFTSAYRPNYGGYYNYNYPSYGNNGYGNYNYYNSYNPYRNYNNNGYGNYNYYNSYGGYNGMLMGSDEGTSASLGYNGYGSNYNYQYNPLSLGGGTTAGGSYVGSPFARIWLTCNGIGCPARG